MLFAELREMVDEGLLTYACDVLLVPALLFFPVATPTLLASWLALCRTWRRIRTTACKLPSRTPSPSTSILQTLVFFSRFLFSSERYDPQVRDHLSRVLHRHGIPVGAVSRYRVVLAEERPLPIGIYLSTSTNVSFFDY
jgi:hypothetical protein